MSLGVHLVLLTTLCLTIGLVPSGLSAADDTNGIALAVQSEAELRLALTDALSSSGPSHYVTYEKGWTLRPYDPDSVPFELRFELHNQFRYTYLNNDGGPSFDASGNRRVVSDRNDFDIWLYSAHIGIKRSGFSLSGEYYMRWLRNIKGSLGNEFESIFDHGFFAQSSAFVIPESLELFVRGSQVTGEQGTGHEVSAGLNWYLFGARNARGTLEVTSLEDSPAEQSRTGYVAGSSGTLLRMQLWTFF